MVGDCSSLARWHHSILAGVRAELRTSDKSAARGYGPLRSNRFFEADYPGFAFSQYLVRRDADEILNFDPNQSRELLKLELLKFHRSATSLKRSEEHTSELKSLMRISYAVFCLKKKNTN